MDDRALVRTGVVGAAIAVLCCATPMLVLALAALGLAGAAVWIDWLIIPALLGFVSLAGVGFYRQRRAATCAPNRPTNDR